MLAKKLSRDYLASVTNKDHQMINRLTQAIPFPYNQNLDEFEFRGKLYMVALEYETEEVATGHTAYRGDYGSVQGEDFIEEVPAYRTGGEVYEVDKANVLWPVLRPEHILDAAFEQLKESA